jgi:hypothetical protein
MGTLIDCIPGRIDARFRQSPPFDKIVLRIHLHGQVVRTRDLDNNGRPGPVRESRPKCFHAPVYMTSVWCPFRNYLRFLEAITVDVQTCGFHWDAEGPEGRLKWERGVDDTGILEVQWSIWRDPQRRNGMRMLLNTRQMVRMLYEAFRRFVESPEYDPTLYEEGEGQWFGANLRELRSPLVEAWLAQPEPQKQKTLELPVEEVESSTNVSNILDYMTSGRRLIALLQDQASMMPEERP